MDAIPSLDAYELSDRYDREEGRVFLTGTQAIVRIALDQARRDRARGLNTAGFISGYRGSPLGGVDLELWRIKERLKRDAILRGVRSSIFRRHSRIPADPTMSVLSTRPSSRTASAA